jgi:beta-lactamase regulating signal transducer with metallopeptidase domain
MNALEPIFRLVVDASWKMSCLILVFLALRSVLRHHVSARVLFWVWIAVAVRLLVPFAVPVKWSPFNLTRPAALASTAMPRFESILEPQLLVATRLQRPEPAGPHYQARTDAWGWMSVQGLAFIWSVGVVVLVIGRSIAYRRFILRLKNNSGPDANAQVSKAVEAASDLRFNGLQIITSDSVSAPALHGIFRPRILFPPGLVGQLTPQEIKLIIAHEMGHCKRRDLAAQALIQASQILHWFNPLIWVAARAAKQDCELACDEYVLRRMDSAEPKVYGATLVKILGLVSQTPKAQLVLGIVESKQHMKRRIEMIIANSAPSFARNALGCALLVLVGVLVLTRESLAQKPAAAETPKAIVATSSPNVTAAAPAGWWKNGSKTAAYVAGVDRDQVHNGLASAYVKSIEPAIDGFGGMMQMCNAENFTGKRLRFSAWMKTEDAKDGGAHLWFRVDGKEKDQMLQFDNMGNRPVMGTTDWQLYSLVLDVPSNAGALAYGFFVSGTGHAWVSGVKIEAVGLDQPVTNIAAANGQNLPKAPVNLAFE